MSKYDERKHRRDRRGRFADKPDSPEQILQRVLGGYNTTAQKYTYRTPQGTRYDPARASLHDRLVADVIAKGVPSDDPEILYTAGGPGVGKSTVLDIVPKPEGAVLIEPDEYKLVLPEYDQLIGAGYLEAAAVVHEESSWLASMTRWLARDQRMNMVFDQTGNYNQGFWSGRLSKDYEAGYRVRVVYVDVPWPEAKRRILNRAKETGRMVPLDGAKEKHVKVARRFKEVVDLPWLHIEFYSTDVPEGTTPVKIMEKLPNSEPVILDEKRYRAFLEKADWDA